MALAVRVVPVFFDHADVMNHFYAKTSKMRVCAGWARGALLAVALGSVAMPAAWAQTAPVNAGTVSRDIQNTTPGLGQYDFGDRGPAPPAPAGKKHTRLIQDPSRDLPEEETLAAPIVHIYLSASLLRNEILAILQDRAFNHTQIGTRDLEEARQKIWKLGIDNKRLLHVHFRVVPQPKVEGKSWLIVEVQEITIRKVEATGTVRRAVLDDIQREASREFYQDKILDLDELDDTIQSRLRLGDVLLHSSVQPVDETHVDIRIEVKPMSSQSPGGMLQYDNDGGWAFGRDRALGTFSAYGLGLSGDKLDLLAMKTADVGNGDYADGTYYGRAEYQVPVGEWGLRFDGWASGLHYHSVKAMPSNSFANGEAIETGMGAIKPVYTSKFTTLDMRADYIFKYTVDRILETERTDEKTEHNLRFKTTLAHALGGSNLLQADFALTEGDIALAADRDSFEQDQAGPRVTGLFTKLEEDAQVTGILTDNQKADYRIAMRGQWASNNLDSMEQFALGGPNGLRAFGAGDAYGDSGVGFSGDVGYAIGWGLRPYALYDIGWVWKTTDSWTGQPSPNNYMLQDAGLGLSATYGPVDLGVSFAHQIGHNQGLGASGTDIDNTTQRYRVWSSVAYHY